MGLLDGIKNAVLGLKDIEVTGNMQVGTLRKQFREQFGTEIRVYKGLNTGKGAKKAEDKATLASICAEGMKVKDITIKKSLTVAEVEQQFKDQMGIGIQIMLPGGEQFAPNTMKLSAVKDA